MNPLEDLSVLRGLFRDPLFSAFAEWKSTETRSSEARFLSLLFDRGAETDFRSYVYRLIQFDDNAFSRACASGVAPSAFLKNAFVGDLTAIDRAVSLPSERYCAGTGEPWNEKTADELSALYREKGYGDFLRYAAFRYVQGELRPILSPSTVSVSDLKGYVREKEEVRDNLENFVEGLPFSDMLLYGDRGTGKSSTVHAMVNLFSARRLRLVEIAKEDILSLPQLKTTLAAIPMKFVVFIDDFALSENDARFSTLKASLQGSMEGQAANVMIVATSNRRHIVEENFDTRRNSIHASDSEQELLSLSDRFGITVLFSSVNKTEYLSIVRALADEEGLKTDRSELESAAERWALLKGGRSPRRAKQFVLYAVACEKKGKPIED